MAVVRIRGEWTISLIEQNLALTHGTTPADQTAHLTVSHADRSRLHGQIQIGKELAEVVGRVKAGNPGVVVLTETKNGELLQDGLEAILYIPPFWPSIDYDFDMLVGILTIATSSMIKNKTIQGKPFALSGVKALPLPIKGK